MRQTTVGRYLVTRLEQCGLGHVFGIPGDYVLGFYDLLVASRIEVTAPAGLVLKKEDREAGSIARYAGGLDGTAVLLDNPFNKTQAEADALNGFVSCWIRAVETLEDMR